jgi:hypothetical protein
MRQCAQIKKDGKPCKGMAVEGADFCAFHLKKALEGEVTPTSPSAPNTGGIVEPVAAVADEKVVASVAIATSDETPEKGDKVPAVIHDKLHPKKIRFIGKGRYSIPSEGVVFTREGQVEEVSHACWERLLSKSESKDVFEEA